ncbi:tropomyosin 1 isoform 3-T3 [Glossina fuscipes fuscipes]
MVENVLSESNRVNSNIWQTVHHRRTSKKELSYANASKKNLTHPPKENKTIRSTVINVDIISNKVATLQLPSSKRLLNDYNTNAIGPLHKEHNLFNKKKKYKKNTISSISIANKIYNVDGKSGSSNKSHIANGSASLPRPKRLNQIRQIKRAHRHLLTSGGNDKQQPTLQSQRAVNKINYHANSCSSKKTLQKNAHSSGRGRESGALSTSRVNKNKNNKGGNYKTNRFRENIQSSSQYRTYNRQTIKKKRVKSINQASSESVTSSRWCSIEKQLDILEKLLHYCDEEENIVLQDWHKQLNANCWSYATSCLQSENEEANPASLNARSRSDVMSNQSISSSEECRNEYICTTQLNMSLVPSTLKRRGHQHHPRFSGTRRSNVTPNVQEILAALNKREITPSHVQSEVGETEATLSTLDDPYSAPSIDEPDGDPAAAQRIKSALNLPLTDSVTTSLGSNSPTPDDSSMVDEGVISAQMPQSPSMLGMSTQMPKEKKLKIKRDKNASEQTKDKKCKKLSNSSKRDKQKRSSGCLETAAEISNDTGSAATDEGIAIDDDDMQTAEWAKLRCTSEAAEIVAEREARRSKNRCSDYPGLAFGRSIFSSDTMMKFNIIRNELHNIMNTQLKRAESEVAALNRRIQLLEEDLERSEERLGSATAKLSEASQAADESERIRKALENRTNMEDDRVAILEAQLAQAKLIAEEADKKYEEVARKLVLMEQDLERSEEKVELSESKIVELEEELRVVGNNLKSLEVSEEKANQREEEYKNQIKTLNTRLKEAEARAEFAERSVQKLQKEVDRLEDDLIVEKERFCLIGDSLDLAFMDLIPGLEPFYTPRNPKPPTPKVPTPTPEELAAMEAAKAEAEAAAAAAAEAAAAAAAAGEAGEAGAESASKLVAEGIEGATTEGGEAAAAPPVKEPPPPPPPPPFEYAIDLPPEGAEVPFVKNYEPPPPGAEPTAPADGAAPPADGAAPPADGAAPPVEGAAPLPAEGATPAPTEGDAPAPAPVEGSTSAAPPPPTEVASADSAPPAPEAAPAAEAPAS